ncbi:MAG: hypothetical protein KDA81_10070 [Planctomycetaceae bacterium]|nr:hypothetical protein [Planctomycetaceae bacterium]
MSIEELLQQMEAYRSRREQKERRPEWLQEFVQQIADHFEPLCNVGRVGFDCQLDERGWTVCMYLGTTEIIGGPRDGEVEHVSFRMDLNQLSNVFSSIDRCEWYSVSNDGDDRFTQPIRSVMCVTGIFATEHKIRLEILGSPPRYIRPGLHIDPFGTPRVS